jgi:hypothetical protein
MALGPQGPAKCDIGAGSCSRMEGRGLGADDSTIGVATALNVGNSNVGDGAITLNDTGDTGRL